MNWKLFPTIVFTLGVIGGCASGNTASDNTNAAAATATYTSNAPRASSNRCDADPAQSAVGQKVNKNLLDRAREQAGAKTARALHPDDVITTEYNPMRLNLRLDDNDTVVSVSCG